MLKSILRLLVVLVVSLLMPCVTRFYYPAFREQIERLGNFLHRHQADLVSLNAITGTELTQLQALRADLDTITTNPAWPKYRELG